MYVDLSSKSKGDGCSCFSYFNQVVKLCFSFVVFTVETYMFYFLFRYLLILKQLQFCSWHVIFDSRKYNFRKPNLCIEFSEFLQYWFPEILFKDNPLHKEFPI